MLYEMMKKEDLNDISKYGKAYGAFLLHCLLHDICDINNFFVFDSMEEFNKIKDKLPEKIILRADAKTGCAPTLGVRGTVATKDEVEAYIKDVKKHNPDGVVLCVDTNTENEGKRIDGSFNVYFEWGEKVYIDYLGQGFDVGGITKGEDRHEVFVIDWDKILFVKPGNLNEYRKYLISDDEYKKSAVRKRQFIMKKSKCSEEEARKIVPDTYKQMPDSIKEELLDKIVFQIYSKGDEVKRFGLKSFGVQGMIRDKELFPVEINRRERFIEKGELEKKKIDNQR